MAKMGPISLGLCSFDAQDGNLKTNLVRIEEIVIQAKQMAWDLIVFPEMTLTGFDMQRKLDISAIQASQQTFCEIAQRHQIAIIYGSVHFGATELPTNDAIFIDAQGQEISRYSKVHPFSLGDEPQHFSSGHLPAQAVLWNGVRIALSVCYDLRFAEVYRITAQDTDLHVNIACWPKRRIQHWKLLCAARALENRCFFMGVNRTGIDSLKLEYEESSGLWSPDGVLLCPEAQIPKLQGYEINFEEIRKFRLVLPALRDRKIKLYQEWFASDSPAI